MTQQTTETNIRHCTICGDVPVKLFLRAQNKDLPSAYLITEEGHAPCWDIWRCTNCGLIFTDWTFTPEQLHALYQQMQDNVYDEEDSTRRLTYARNLRTLKQFVPQEGNNKPRVLDIGCATGGFLFEAQQNGWEVEGAELSHWAVERAAARGVTTVHEGTVHTLGGAPGRFQAIVMLDYIEHDDNPSALLKRCSELLQPGGIVFISTPDIGSPTARLFGSKWWGINPMHLNYFARRTMKKVLEQQGFEIVRMRYYQRLFTLGYWGSRLGHFHTGLAKVVPKIFSWLHIANIPLPLNLFDSMEVIARKK